MFTTCLASDQFFFFLFSDTQNYFYVFCLTDKYCNLLKADYIFPSFIWTFLISLASSSARILQVFETALESLCVCLVLVFSQSEKNRHSWPQPAVVLQGCRRYQWKIINYQSSYHAPPDFTLSHKSNCQLMLTDNSSKTKIKTYSFSEEIHFKYLTLLELKYKVIYCFLQCKRFAPIRYI